jgi:protein-L-isoaspartate O-methyltransferase
MLAFGLTVFAGAFLLFLVQPLIAKFVLPWFGGSPAVWTACMLFFQVLLVGGYACAHLGVRHLTPRRQVVLYLVLLVVALALLPITPGDQWKPPDVAHPTARILLLLAACLGLPYLALAAAAPLMQAWFSRAHPGVSPYRLYALSNAGSFLALVSYPFAVEPNLTRQAQAGWWSAGLATFALGAAWCGAVVWRRAGGDATPAPPVTGRVPIARRVLWLALPACGVALLLAVTNEICQEIAVVPFLWVLPLALYLLTFVIAFDGARWYRRWLWLPAMAASMLAVLWLMAGDHVDAPEAPWLRPVAWLIERAEEVDLPAEIGIHLAALFAFCMVCHGELYRLRPPAARLTGYYLAIAAGGAAGGFFVAIVAPLVFSDYFELQATLFLAAVLALAAVGLDPESRLRGGRPRWAWAALLAALAALGGGLSYDVRATLADVDERSRNFYGVLRVFESFEDDPEMYQVTLQHGATTHGLQFPWGEKRRLPTTYYTATSGVGRLLRALKPEGGRKIAVVGLGTGSLAAWGRPGDRMLFYEINPEVERIARSRFSFLADSAAQSEVVLGDARLSLEREPPQGFDVIVLDAFTSDAIPVHLLTREAFETYRRHLAPGGVIAVHVSNDSLDLAPVVLRAAEHLGFAAAVVVDDEREDEEEERTGAYGSDWVLLSRDEGVLARSPIAEATSEPPDIPPDLATWTDESSALLPVLLIDEDSFLARLTRR